VLEPCRHEKLARGAQDKEHAMSQKLSAAIVVIGIDIGKNSFHIVGHDQRGAIVLRQKWSRGQVETRFDRSCQRNMLFTFDGKRYGPALDIENAFVAFVRGQSDEAQFETVAQPGFQHLSGYVEFWLGFIGVREVVTLTLERTWDGRAVDMIEAGKKEGRRTGKAILMRMTLVAD
jgi:hypothetical protein